MDAKEPRRSAFLMSTATSRASRTSEWPFPTMCCADREATRAGGQVARRPVGLSWQRSVHLNCNCRPRSDRIAEAASEGVGGGVHWPRPGEDELEKGGVDEVVGEGSHEGCGESGSWRCWRSLLVKVVRRVEY